MDGIFLFEAKVNMNMMECAEEYVKECTSELWTDDLKVESGR